MDFDRYRIQYPPGWRLDHQIGSGGFGMVYKERIHRLGMFRPEVCAVKKINLGTLNITGDQQQYKREIAILASLHVIGFRDSQPQLIILTAV